MSSYAIPSDGFSLRVDTPLVIQVFSGIRFLSRQGVLKTSLVENAEAADPVMKRISGKGVFEAIQDGMFRKHGHERLARLVRVHLARLKESMPTQSVKFFSSLAKKITTFIEKTPILRQVFDTVKGFTTTVMGSALSQDNFSANAAPTPSAGGGLTSKKRRY